MTWNIARLRLPALAALGGTLILLGAGRAEAQIGTWNPAYGSNWFYDPYAGSGPGFGYGLAGIAYNPYGFGYAPGGISVADMAMMKTQMYALNASRYNLMNAEAATAYQAANLFQQEAVNDVASRYRTAKQAYGPRYNIRTGSPGYSSYGAPRAPLAEAEAEVQPLLPLDQIIAPDGEVMWPVGAPQGADLDPKREVAGKAIQDAVQPGVGGKRGTLLRIVRARQKLADYALPALQQIRANRPQDEDDFVRFVRSLDLALRDLAENGGPAATARASDRETEPEDTPKSGGDVLKQTIQQDQEVKEGAPVPLAPDQDRASVRPVAPLAPRPVAARPGASTEVTRQVREQAAAIQNAQDAAALTAGLPGQPGAAPMLNPPIPPGTLEPTQDLQGRPTNVNTIPEPPATPGNLPPGARPAPPVPVPGGVVVPPSE